MSVQFKLRGIMKIFGILLSLMVSTSAFADDLGCEFSAPNLHEWVQVPLKTEMWTFEKTYGDFLYSLDIDGKNIIAISIKDTVRNVTSQTIATTGAGIFAKPRQLSLESNGQYAEVNCW